MYKKERDISTMADSNNIGVPKEIKAQERRVALLPGACKNILQLGHTVLLQQGAGIEAGYSDDDYEQIGVKIVASAAMLYRQSSVIVKVKEPVDNELEYLNDSHNLFSFLHLAANKNLARQLKKNHVTAFAYETLEVDGEFPILAPMSAIAGKISVQIGTTLLHSTQGGKGVLLGGVTDSHPGEVLVIGAGSVGMAAAKVAQGLGASVRVLDINQSRLDRVATQNQEIKFLLNQPAALENLLPTTDLLIGAVMIPGRHAPIVITHKQIAMLQPGSVAVDVAIDQGGCLETSHPTSWDNPVYQAENVQHFSVTNMPGAVPKTASQALSETILPHLIRFLNGDWQSDQGLISALNIADGKYVNAAIIKEMSR